MRLPKYLSFAQSTYHHILLSINVTRQSKNSFSVFQLVFPKERKPDAKLLHAEEVFRVLQKI